MSPTVDKRRGRLADLLAWLRITADLRTFGLDDAERRKCVRHGYLLALEEVAREASEA